MKYKNNSGFTLVEVLAVVVILGILMVIAMPSYTTVYNSIKRTTYINKMRTINVAGEAYASNTEVKDYVKALYGEKTNWCKEVAVSDLIAAGYIVSDSDYEDMVEDIYTGRPMGYHEAYNDTDAKRSSYVALCYCYDTFNVKSYLIKDLGGGKTYYEGETVRVKVLVNGEYIPQYRQVTHTFSYNSTYNKIKKAAQEGKNEVTADGKRVEFHNYFASFTEEELNSNTFMKEHVERLIINTFTKNEVCNVIS